MTARNESEQDEPTGVLSLTLDNTDFVDSPRGGIVGETPEVGFPHDEGVARFSDDIAYVDANEALDKPEKVQRPAYEDYGIRRDDHEI